MSRFNSLSSTNGIRHIFKLRRHGQARRPVPLPGSLSTVISPPIIWQNLADRQTQTGAVVPPGGGAVHLREGLEQLAQVLPADPDAGIADVHFGPLAIPNAHLAHRRCSGVSVRISATRVSNGRSEWRCPPLCAGAAAGRDRQHESNNQPPGQADRKSTRLNSSHLGISYAVFCFKKDKRETCAARGRASLNSRHVGVSYAAVG